MSAKPLMRIRARDVILRALRPHGAPPWKPKRNRFHETRIPPPEHSCRLTGCNAFRIYLDGDAVKASWINGPYSYDGKGINGPDEYKSRVLTFHHLDQKTRDAVGPLFALAPEMAVYLEAYALPALNYLSIKAMSAADRAEFKDRETKVRELLARAKGGAA